MEKLLLYLLLQWTPNVPNQMADGNDFNCKEVTWNCPKVKINVQRISTSPPKDGFWHGNVQNRKKQISCLNICWTKSLKLTVYAISFPPPDLNMLATERQFISRGSSFRRLIGLFIYAPAVGMMSCISSYSLHHSRLKKGDYWCSSTQGCLWARR